MFSGVIPTTYLHGSLSSVQFPGWFNLAQKQKSTDRLLIELENHCSLKTTTTHRNEFNLDYIPGFNRIFLNYLQKHNLNDCLTLMNSYYLNQNDLKAILSMYNWRKKIDFNKDLIKLTQTRRVPFEQVDINRLKTGLSGVREDDEDFDGILSDDDDKENHNEDNQIIKRIKPTTLRLTK